MKTLSPLFALLLFIFGMSYGFGIGDVVEKPGGAIKEILDEPFEEMPDFCMGETLEDGDIGDCFEDEDEVHHVAARAWGNMYFQLIEAGIIDEDTFDEGDSWIPYMPEITGWQADIRIYPERVRIGKSSNGALVLIVNKGLEPVMITKLTFDGGDEENFEIVKENCIGKPLTEWSTAGCGLIIKATGAGESTLKILFDIVGTKEVPVEKEGKSNGCTFSREGSNLFIPLLVVGLLILGKRRLLKRSHLIN